MANNDGAVRMRTAEEILADLRNVQTELDCTVDEARAVRAIQAVERIEERISSLAAKVDEGQRRARITEFYIRSRHSGDKQANAVFDDLLKRYEKGQ